MRDAARISLFDLDALDRNAECRGQDLPKDSLVALTLALRTHACDQSVRLDIDHDMFVGDAAGAVQVAGQAQPSILSRRFARGAPGREARLIGGRERGFEQPGAIGGIVGVAARGRVGHLVGAQQVDAPQFDGGAAGLVCGEVDESLQQEQRLRLAGAADGIDRHGVGEHAVEIDADRGNAIEAGNDLRESRGGNGRREHRDIGTVVGLGLHAQAEEAPLDVQRQVRRGDEVARMTVTLG